MKLGRFGVWTAFRLIGRENGPRAAVLAENLGYGTFWLGGSPRLRDVRPLLEATDRIAVATGIVNVWDYEPSRLAEEYAELAGEFGERLLVGIGIGHREATEEYRRPLTTMREFLDGIDAIPAPIPADRRCVAALGPKMLRLATERSLGPAPYFVPVVHTVAARQEIGDGAWLAPELAFRLGSGPDRHSARTYAAKYLALENYAANLRRFGFDDEDLEGGGSDRLLNALVPQGEAAQIALAAHSHLEAGADHVALQPVGIAGVPSQEWTEIADALELRAEA